MAKTARKVRGKFSDEKYLGPEPTVTADATQAHLARAYNWFNYFYNSEDAKAFTLSYLKSIKYDKKTLQKLNQVKAIDLHNIGWNCRLLECGSTLPGDAWVRIECRIKELVSGVDETVSSDDSTGTEEVALKNIISIQDRINNKASELIGELQEELDVFFTEGTITFDIKKWSLEKGIKPQIAKRIADKFRPQYEEITEALKGKDPELVEAYKGWRKPVLKVMALFIKRIIDHLDNSIEAQKTIRKPRAKKVKPASVLVAKMKYLDESKEYGKSVDPKDIVGASQVWVFNTKYRNLSVLNAAGSGLTVAGSSIKGFDDKTSITKKLRKPEPVLKQVKEGGKIVLRKVMDGVKCKASTANGRMNAETIIVRVVK